MPAGEYNWLNFGDVVITDAVPPGRMVMLPTGGVIANIREPEMPTVTYPMRITSDVTSTAGITMPSVTYPSSRADFAYYEARLTSQLRESMRPNYYAADRERNAERQRLLEHQSMLNRSLLELVNLPAPTAGAKEAYDSTRAALRQIEDRLRELERPFTREEYRVAEQRAENASRQALSASQQALQARMSEQRADLARLGQMIRQQLEREGIDFAPAMPSGAKPSKPVKAEPEPNRPARQITAIDFEES